MYQIDNQSRNPVYEQIIEQIEKYILTGILKSGEQLPSVRQMSLQMHLNPNTVQRAYTELDRKGAIYTVTGVGSFVSEDAPEMLREERRRRIADLKPRIRELVLSGINKEEIIALVNSVYEEEKHD